MAVVLDGTLGIQRNQSGDIENIIWFLYGLPTDSGAPKNAVFLNESFGKSSPQMISFEMAGEEYVVYADWDTQVDTNQAAEVKRFYKEYGYILISALQKDANINQGLLRREWITPVKYYEDYVTMASAMAEAG